tara:strand:- start:369 stop:884 length:516 start_codon:yes stop_codon:yes gene_type:complete
MENHDNQNDERWERVQNTLIDIRDGQQSIYEYLRGIELCECKDDQQPKADLGSFMSSNEIETVDLDQVIEDKKSYIHEIKQLPKGKWIDLNARCISMQEESTLPNKAKSKGCFEDHRTKIWFIEWENSPFEGPKIIAGKSYLIEGAVTDSYENQVSLIFNKNTRVIEVKAE